MPQLILKPWLWIMLSSWLVLLIILTPKVEKHKFNNQLETTNTKKPEFTAWNWTWH